MNVKFFNIENRILYPKKDLSGILNLCLIKYISNNFKIYEMMKMISPNIQEIISKLKNEINYTEDIKDNIRFLLEEKKGNNILTYSQYLNMIVNEEIIDNLFKALDAYYQSKITSF